MAPIKTKLSDQHKIRVQTYHLLGNKTGQKRLVEASQFEKICIISGHTQRLKKSLLTSQVAEHELSK
jgi:hypothetical protein